MPQPNPVEGAGTDPMRVPVCIEFSEQRAAFSARETTSTSALTPGPLPSTAGAQTTPPGESAGVRRLQTAPPGESAGAKRRRSPPTREWIGLEPEYGMDWINPLDS